MAEKGLITLLDPGADKPIVELAMEQCVHCGAQFPRKPVKKLIGQLYRADHAAQMEMEGRTMRGWCMNCNGPLCGPGCAACVPTEQLLENYEKGRPLDFRPTVSYISKAIGE